MGRKDGASMKFMLDKEKLEMIQNAGPDEMSDLVLAVQMRYNELFPDWELSYYVLEKKKNKNEQLNAMITLLEKLKEG